MSKPIFRIKPFLKLLTITLIATVVMMYLHAQFDIPFKLMQAILGGAVVVMFAVAFIYFYIMDRSLLKKNSVLLQVDDLEMQQMEQKLEMLLEQAKKDKHAS